MKGKGPNHHSRPQGLLSLPFAFLVAGCASTDSPSEPQPDPSAPARIFIARINEENVSLQDALDTYQSSHSGHGVLVRGEEAVRELAGRIVERTVFLQEALALGLDQDQEVKDIVAEYRHESAEILFWEGEVKNKANVPEEEVEAFYAKTDRAVSISIIVTELPEEAEALRERVLNGEDFSELAHSGSIDPSRSFGGLVGFKQRGQLEPAMEQAAFALTEVGSLTPVVETSEGYTFARLDESVENAIRPPREKAIPAIRTVLKNRAEEELRTEVEERLSRDSGLEVHENLLTQAILLESSTPDAVVARSAGKQLTLQEFRDSLNPAAVERASAEEVEQGAKDMARSWALKQALRVAVVERGYSDDPELNRKVARFERDVVMSTLVKRYVYADLKFTDAQVREYYEAHLDDEFTQPAEVKISNILVATDEEAEDILRRLKEGEEFGAIARELSLDPAASAHGGRMGWARVGTLLPELEERAFALPDGGVDGPIQTEHGFHVIEVTDFKPSRVIPWGRVQTKVRELALKKAQQDAYGVWAERLRVRADIEILDSGIATAVAWLDAEHAFRQATAPEAAATHPPPAESSAPVEQPAEPVEQTAEPAPDTAGTEGGG